MPTLRTLSRGSAAAVLLLLGAACADDSSSPTEPGTPGRSPAATAVDKRGPKGPSTSTRGIRAYAFVRGSDAPVIDPERTFGFVGISSPYPGIYCLQPAEGIDTRSVPVMVGSAGSEGILARWAPEAPVLSQSGPDCPTENHVRVTVVNYSTGLFSTDGGFTVMLP